MARYGQSIVLSSVLALLSYVPFVVVAKTTLIFCGVVFVFDPFPPVSRLISLFGVITVGVLGRIERTWREGQESINVSGEEVGEDDETKKGL